MKPPPKPGPMQNASYVVIDLTSMPVHVDQVYLPPESALALMT